MRVTSYHSQHKPTPPVFEKIRILTGLPAPVDDFGGLADVLEGDGKLDLAAARRGEAGVLVCHIERPREDDLRATPIMFDLCFTCSYVLKVRFNPRSVWYGLLRLAVYHGLV